MDYNKQLITLSILICLLIFFIYIRSFENDVPQCKGYVLNVYLYVLLGLLITAFSVLFIAKRRYPITMVKSLLAFAVAALALFGLYSISPKQVLLNHVVWLVFLIAMSTFVYTIWRYTKYRGTLNTTIIATVLIFSLMTLIVFIKPDLVKLSWGSTLTILLLGVLLAWIIPMFFSWGKDMTTYYRFLAAFLIVIFSFLVLYDTKLLKERSKTCILPDYPRDSIGLFLDIINIFGGMSFLN